jgi:hypothetical protein
LKAQDSLSWRQPEWWPVCSSGLGVRDGVEPSGPGAWSVGQLPLMPGPMTIADKVNIATKSTAARTGALQVPQRRYSRRSTGIDKQQAHHGEGEIAEQPADQRSSGQHFGVMKRLRRQTHHDAERGRKRLPRRGQAARPLRNSGIRMSHRG